MLRVLIDCGPLYQVIADVQVKPLQQEPEAVDRKIANITKSVENGLMYDESISGLNNL